MKKIELLAPAGDLEKLKIAYKYGADAVYVGGKLFSLRANATNFSMEDLKEAVNYAHKLNKKLYVTVNIALHNKELEQIKNYLIELDKIGIDAIIFSDISIIKIAKKHTNLELHMSTQQSTLNKESASLLKELGVSRVVLAREASREDIEDIILNTNIEIEVFIHGAMCASYSGRCVMSNYLTNRDANRGGCSQVCRWDFDLFENKENITKEKPFTFCSKDLSNINHVKDMIELNITSLKIEGRMRSIYYIATVVGTYRTIIDKIYNNKLTEEDLTFANKILDRSANRESVSQFYIKEDKSNYQYYNGRQEISNQDFLGVVKEYDELTKIALIEQRNYFTTNEEYEIFGPKIEPFRVTFKEIIDDKNESIDIVRHPKQKVKIKIEQSITKDSFIRKVI